MLKTFMKMKEQYIKTEMEYTVNFWMMLISGIVTRVLYIAIPFIIYQNIPDIAGWKVEEINLIMSYLFIAEGLCSILFEGIWQIPEMVFHGKFDSILSRPISPLFQVLSYGMGLQGIGVFIFGIICMFFYLNTLGLLEIGGILLSLFFIICGCIILMSVYLLSNSLVFWFDAGGKTSIPYMISSIGQYARYPISIYPVLMQIILLFIIPYGFIGVVPVQAFREGNIIFYCLGILGMSIIFLFLSRFVFYKGIKNYESMGM